MKTDILYSFRRCPYAIRVRWALLICKIKVELREVDLKNKPSHFLENSDTKTVPILIKKNGEIIEESFDIILWALSETKNKSLENQYLKNKNQSEILDLISENDNEFKYHLDRFKYSTRFNYCDKEFHFLEANRFIKKCSKLLSKNKWFFGEEPSIADWCIWPFIRQFKIACESQKKTDYFEYSIKEWLEYFENHQKFKKLMYKYDPWQTSSKKNYFP